MKYKKGDKVRIRKDLICNREYGECTFYDSMEACAKEHNYVLTILGVNKIDGYYAMAERCYPCASCWTDEMIEGLAEEFLAKSKFHIGDEVEVIKGFLNYKTGDKFIIGHIDINSDGKPLYMKSKDSWIGCEAEDIKKVGEPSEKAKPKDPDYLIFHRKDSVPNLDVPTTRAECLEKAKEIVCKGRQEYGGVEDNFQAIASYWSAYLGRDIFPKDVAIMMVLLKIARDSTGTFKADNYIDLCGYAACACELASKEE